MPRIQKRNTPERSKLQPKATIHDARVDGGRPRTASEILTAPTDSRLMIPKIIGWPPTLRWPPDADQLVTPSATKTLQTFMWPLTMDELLTLSPAAALEKAEEERRKPTTEKLLAWFGERLLVAYRASKESQDPDTRRRLCREAWKEGWNDIQQALAAAHTRRRRDNAARGTILGKDSAKQKRESRNRRRTLIASSLSRYADLPSYKAAEAFVEQYPELQIDTLWKDIDWIRRKKK